MAYFSMDNNDRELLLAAMKRLKHGDFTPLDTTFFSDKELGDHFNDMLESVKDRNNDFLVRLNDAVRGIGDNTHIKNMIDSVEGQNGAVMDLLDLRGKLRYAVERLDEYNLEMLALSKQIRNTCDPCVDDMNISSKEVETLVADIKETVQEISFGLLSMEVPLPDETYVLLDRFLAMMNMCTQALENRSTIIFDVAQSIEGIHGRVEAVIDDVISAKKLIDQQNSQADIFISGVDRVHKSTGEISEDCYNTGRYLQRVTRALDRARNDMYRKNSDLPIHDKLRIFEVDHNVLLWRTYNNMMDLEVLLTKNVETVDRCKFALWCREEAESYITETDGFKNAVDAHTVFHKHILGCFRAKFDNDIALAKKEFDLSCAALDEFIVSLMELHNVYVKNGIVDEHSDNTMIW